MKRIVKNDFVYPAGVHSSLFYFGNHCLQLKPPQYHINYTFGNQFHNSFANSNHPSLLLHYFAANDHLLPQHRVLRSAWGINIKRASGIIWWMQKNDVILDYHWIIRSDRAMLRDSARKLAFFIGFCGSKASLSASDFGTITRGPTGVCKRLLKAGRFIIISVTKPPATRPDRVIACMVRG